MSNPFVNRITGYVTKRASELTANPANSPGCQRMV